MPRASKPRRHGDGWQINWTDATGRRRYRTYPTHREALAALARHRTEAVDVRRGERVLPPEKSWEDLEAYFEVVKADKRSLKDDKSRMRLHLRPAFGGLKLNDLSDVRISRFRAGLIQRVKRGQLAVATVRLILALLKSMLNVAVDAGWMVKAPKIKLPRPEDKPYPWIRTEEQLGAFLEAASKHGYPGLMPLYATALYTGMRAGELAGLSWADIDLENRLVTVQRSYESPTKSSKIRRVPILDPLLPVLRSWREEGHAAGLVFPNRAGAQLDPAAKVYKDLFHHCRKAAGVEYLTFHALRHTFASHWMLNGGDIYRLQKILGHASVQTTERYAHLAPEAFKQDWGRFGDFTPG